MEESSASPAVDEVRDVGDGAIDDIDQLYALMTQQLGLGFRVRVRVRVRCGSIRFPGTGVNQHGLGTGGKGIESSVGRRPKRTQKSILGLGLSVG